jgi:hypothetical protein
MKCSPHIFVMPDPGIKDGITKGVRGNTEEAVK